MIAVGALPRPAFASAITFRGPGGGGHGLIQDIGAAREAHRVRRAARVSWPLPAYELALMTPNAQQASGSTWR